MSRLEEPGYPYLVKRLRKLIDFNLPEPIFDSPIDGRHIRINCRHCELEYVPPWNEPLKNERSSVVSTVQEGKIWVLTGIPTKCPCCENENLLHFPKSEKSYSYKLSLFGDEFYERIQDKHLYVYVFFGCLPDVQAEINEALKTAKEEILPDKDPNSWVLHASEVRNSKWRASNNVQLPIEGINRCLLRICNSISKSPTKRFVSATVHPPFDDTHVLANVRRHSVEACLCASTFFIAKAGYHISYIIESTKEKSADDHIDYDIEILSRSLRRNLSYLYMCRDKHVDLPITESKGYHPNMEIADLIAYMVRRYLYLNHTNKRVDFRIDNIGPVYWNVFMHEYVINHLQTGFPWEIIKEHSEKN